MATLARRVLIVGCGYVGLELGRQLSALGHRVFGLRRGTSEAETLRAAGLTPLVGDLTQAETLATLPGPFDWVVNTVSSSRGGTEEYRRVYRDGTRTLLAWLRDHPPEAFAYTSSTSVYSQTSGEWVDESSPVEPKTDTGRLLVETEQLVLDAARAGIVAGRVLRVAGIYGPGRGHLFRQFLKGEARIQDRGTRWMNMIHRDDVASAIVATLTGGRAGEVYNAVDAEPVSQLGFLSWLAEGLDRPLPPRATDEETKDRKRGVTHKRVSHRKLRNETGWVPRYPTFRDGYAQELMAASCLSQTPNGPQSA